MLKRIALSAMTAVLCLAAGAGTAQAHTIAASAHRPGLAGIKVINLRRSFEAHLAHVKPHRISGIIYARGKQPRGAAKANATCTEPNCDLVYNGGPVQHSPHVFIDFWGPNWLTDTGQEASAVYLKRLFKGLGTESGVPSPDMWSTITSQYGDGAGYPSFTGAVFAAAYNDTAAPPTGATQTDLAAEADAFGALLTSQGYTIGNDSQLVIATQSGTCPQYFAGCSGGGYCAWHSYSNEPYINLPYILDAGQSCGENFFNGGSAGLNDGWSIVGGHEYAETITDPIPREGWIDDADQYGGEIGDKCAWGGEAWGVQDPYGNLKLRSGTFAMQSLWDNSSGSCEMAAPGAEDTVTVTSPGDQTNNAGDNVNAPVTGTSSDSNPLEWSATGLPPGLSIGGASGVISGSPTVGGVYQVTVTASDSTGASGSASFNWTVNGPSDAVFVATPANQTGYATANASLQLQGFSSAKLPLTWSITGLPPGLGYDQSSGLITGAPTTPDTFTVIATATDTNGVSGSATFSWTVKPDVGKPIKGYHSKCLDDHSSIVTDGNKVDINSCNGSGSEKWTLSSTGKLIVLGVCLTDPGGGGSGAKLVVFTCHNYKSQTWTHRANGEYVLKLNGLCLTDPSRSTTNGTQVQLRACHDYADQRWSLP